MAANILTHQQIKSKYNAQKKNAKVRGIDWNITFDEWVKWWGDDIHKRGSSKSGLQMQRLHDKGAYQLGNIVKGYPLKNAVTRGRCKILKTQLQLAKEHQQHLDSLMFAPSREPDDENLSLDFEKEIKSNGYISYSRYAIDR